MSNITAINKMEDKRENMFSMSTQVSAKKADDKSTKSVICAEKVNVFYGNTQALFDVSIGVQDQKITALIGPSGCGNQLFCVV